MWFLKCYYFPQKLVTENEQAKITQRVLPEGWLVGWLLVLVDLARLCWQECCLPLLLHSKGSWESTAS